MRSSYSWQRFVMLAWPQWSCQHCQCSGFKEQDVPLEVHERAAHREHGEVGDVEEKEGEDGGQGGEDGTG